MDDFCSVPGRMAWLAAEGVVGLDCLLLLATGVSVPLQDLAIPVGSAGLLFALTRFYTARRPEPPIAAACGALSFIIVITAALCVFSYLCAMVPMPLLDARYAAWDAAVGFDWLAHRAWVASSPAVETALELAYSSIYPQLIVIIPALAWFDRPALRGFLTAFFITAVVTITLSAVVPAMGGFYHHQPPLAGLAQADPLLGRWHYAHLEALRAGTLNVIPLRAAEGLVQWPSFHAVMAVLFAHALWRVPRLRAPGLALNALVLVSTLSIGGHYLVDVVAGVLLAGAVLALRRPRAARRASTPDAAFAGP